MRFNIDAVSKYLGGSEKNGIHVWMMQFMLENNCNSSILIDECNIKIIDNNGNIHTVVDILSTNKDIVVDAHSSGSFGTVVYLKSAGGILSGSCRAICNEDDSQIYASIPLISLDEQNALPN